MGELDKEEIEALRDLAKLSPEDRAGLFRMAQIERDLRGAVRVAGWLSASFRVLVIGVGLAIAFNWNAVKERLGW